MYEYRCQPLRVIDGDTVDVRLDMGLRHSQDLRVRLAGINSPEIHNAEQHEAGVAAKDHLEELLRAVAGEYLPCVVRTKKDAADKYGGRWDGELWLERDGTFDAVDFHFAPFLPSVNGRMLIDGYAVPYTGGKR